MSPSTLRRLTLSEQTSGSWSSKSRVWARLVALALFVSTSQVDAAIVEVQADAQFEHNTGTIAIMPADCRSTMNCAAITREFESVINRNRKTGPVISSARVQQVMRSLGINVLDADAFDLLVKELSADTVLFPVYAHYGPVEDDRVARILGRKVVRYSEVSSTPTISLYAISRARRLVMFGWSGGNSLFRTDGQVFVRLTMALAEHAFHGHYRPLPLDRPNPPATAPTAEPTVVPTSAFVFATGTGFSVRPDGFLLTSNHIVSEAAQVFVTCSGSDRKPARIVASSKRTDLALLQVDGVTPDYLTLAPIRSGRLGDPVFTVGFPVTDILGRDPKFTDGTISGLSGIGEEEAFLQISVPIQPGNSGGPLVNDRGEVLGVVAASAAIIPFLQATDSLPQNVNFAVKGEYARVLFDPPPTRLPAPSRRDAIARAQSSLCFIEATR